MITKELRLSADLYTRDNGGLAELTAASGDVPKDYCLLRVEIEASSEIKTYSHRRGAYVCTVVLVMAPFRQAMAMAEVRAGERSEARRGDDFYGISQDGPETDAEARARWTRETGGHPDDIPVLPSEISAEDQERYADISTAANAYGHAVYRFMCGDSVDVKAANERLHATLAAVAKLSRSDAQGEAPRPIHPSEVNVYVDRPEAPRTANSATVNAAPFSGHPGDQRSVGWLSDAQPTEAEVTAKLRAEQAAKRREFQIETIRDKLWEQDASAAPSGGVRPFSSRLAFARILGNLSNTITTMVPRPGGSDVAQYRDILKGIAANCVRELERVGVEGTAAL